MERPRPRGRKDGFRAQTGALKERKKSRRSVLIVPDRLEPQGGKTSEIQLACEGKIMEEEANAKRASTVLGAASCYHASDDGDRVTLEDRPTPESCRTARCELSASATP